MKDRQAFPSDYFQHMHARRHTTWRQTSLPLGPLSVNQETDFTKTDFSQSPSQSRLHIHVGTWPVTFCRLVTVTFGSLVHIFYVTSKHKNQVTNFKLQKCSVCCTMEKQNASVIRSCISSAHWGIKLQMGPHAVTKLLDTKPTLVGLVVILLGQKSLKTIWNFHLFRPLCTVITTL